MPWIQDEMNSPVFTHPSAPGWELKPYDGKLLIRASDWDYEVEFEGDNLRVYGSMEGAYEAAPCSVYIPFVIIVAIADWLRENRNL